MQGHSLIIYTDGGARGNPGPAAYGVYIADSKGQEHASIGRAIGVATNNVAEYSAMREAYSWILEHEKDLPSLELLDFRMDSLLVCNQLKGMFKVKSPELSVIYQQIKKDEEMIRRKKIQIMYTHVPRAQNTQADRLVNMALDKLL